MTAKMMLPVWSRRTVMLVLLIFFVLLSGMSVTYTKFESRQLFSQLEAIRVERDRLIEDWGRLQIELATWAEHGRIEGKASSILKMEMPKAIEIMVIKN